MYDVIIVGAGPIGLYASFYCGMRSLKAICLEALPYGGGQLTNIYTEKFIYDLPGFPKITAGDFIKKLEEQYMEFSDKIAINYETSVDKISKNSDETFTVTTNKGELVTKAVLLACGAGSFKPRPIGVPNSEHFTNISYSVKAKAVYKDKNVAVLGGGDSAVDWALMLEEVAKTVTLIHRRNEFRAHEHSIELLRKSSVKILTPFTVSSLTGSDDKVTELVLKNAENDEVMYCKTDSILVNYGFIPSGGKFKEWGIEIADGGILVKSDTSTSVKGIFAVGNCSVYDGKIKTIAVGLGEVPIAITSITKYLNPGKIIGTVYSSMMKDK